MSEGVGHLLDVHSFQQDYGSLFEGSPVRYVQRTHIQNYAINSRHLYFYGWRMDCLLMNYTNVSAFL